MNQAKIITARHALFTLCCVALGAAVTTDVSAAEQDNRVPAQSFEFHHGDVLGTSLDLTVVAPDERSAATVESAVLGEVERLRLILSGYDPAAELARLNASPVRTPVKVSDELAEVLGLYEQWNRRTAGAYNGHLGDLIALWKEAERANRLPTDAQLALVVKTLKEPAWKVDRVQKTAERLLDQQINVDSLGKGYIIGKAVTAGRTASKDVTGILLNIGGDVRVWGQPPVNVGSTWTIGVADPSKAAANDKPMTRLNVPPDRAVASSGNYERFYTIDGKKYSHILDPRTGRPTSTAAATVIAADSATANALATSLCVLGPGRGMELIRSVPGTEAMIIGADGNVVRSARFKALEAASDKQASPAESASAFPKDFQLTIDLETVQTKHKPYVYVWITDADGKHVRTLGAWGNERKYEGLVREWWKLAKDDPTLMSVTHATQKAGKYSVMWDGKDQQGKAVAPGTYSVWVEVAAEKGPHVAKSATIECGTDAATSRIEASSAFLEVSIHYGPRR